MEVPVVSLIGFSREELLTLHQLLIYAQDHLLEEREELDSPPGWPGPQLKNRHYLSPEGRSALRQSIGIVSFMIQQLEGVLRQDVPLDRAMDLAVCDIPSFRGYLDDGMRLNGLGVRYVQRMPYDDATKEQLLRVYSLEYRFLDVLRDHVQ